MTEGIKVATKKKTAAIGDGGNDVGMIQQVNKSIIFKKILFLYYIFISNF